ncbi:MAG: hypothetical protein KBC73_13190 [Burkholderiaceae bacterium]|nr:hypothetical protein [Burkholderiaceae bacterium]
MSERIDRNRDAFEEFRRRCFHGGGPFAWASLLPLELQDLLPLVAGTDGFSLIVTNEGIVLTAYGDTHHVAWAQLTPASVLELHAQMIAGQAAALQALADSRKAAAATTAGLDIDQGGAHALH